MCPVKMKTEGDWESWDRALQSTLSLPGVTLGVTVPDTPHPGPRARKSGKSYAEIAQILEHGEPLAKIPARPVFGPAMDKHRDLYEDAAREALTAATHGRDWRGDMDALADRMVDDVKAEIEDYGHQPPLAETTVRRKGHDQPWVESHAMVEALEGVVSIEAKGYDARAARFRDSRGRFQRIRGVE